MDYQLWLDTRIVKMAETMPWVISFLLNGWK
jgi:hypothetical protein